MGTPANAEEQRNHVTRGTVEGEEAEGAPSNATTSTTKGKQDHPEKAVTGVAPGGEVEGASSGEQQDLMQEQQQQQQQQQTSSSLSAASILAETSQCLDEIFRTAILCFYEPPPAGGEGSGAGDEDKTKKDKEETGPGGAEGEEVGGAGEGPGFVVSVGKTILSSSSSSSSSSPSDPSAAGGAGAGGGQRVDSSSSSVVVDFGDVAVGQTARAILRIANRRHQWLDYAIRCSMATVTHCRLRVDGGRPFSGYAVQGALRLGEVRDLSLEAEPSKAGEAMDEGVVTVTVGGRAQYVLVLRGRGIDARAAPPTTAPPSSSSSES